MSKIRKAACIALACATFISSAAAQESTAPASPNKIADSYLLCLLHLQDTDAGLINARDGDPKEDVAQAVAARDYRPAGYRQPGSVEALGTECPQQVNAFRIVLGFDKAPYDPCMKIYDAEAKPYVTNYNRALTEAAKRAAVDICAPRR